MVSVSGSRIPIWSQTRRKSTKPRSLSLARSESGLRSIVTAGCVLGGSLSGTHSSALINRFGLFGKTAFAAERVLGNVISSGVKVLVLAVIVGIGLTLLSQFTAGFGGNRPTIKDAMSMVLAALSLLGLGIFGPRIANGIVSGGPQLGAGAAVGTGVAAGGVVVAGTGFRRGRGQGGASAGRSSAEPPACAARMKRSQTVSHGASAATNAVRSGDHGGGGASVDLSEGER